MRDTGCRASGHNSFANKIFEKGLDRVEFARNTFEGVFVVFERLFKLFEMISRHIFGFTNI